ncbi:MAG TPA: 50S ribosomal protein L9 [Deltaproteobacteria bacterium]|nr:MAG: 50S ribosomal protein L9 [Deltaproteobacteria bacterium GWA2_55_82]OGQ62277.1 MAG: 50S ribosomal protein L9 [Deltaproteobacteria bacterium RIFCSPLOWO2_02_FULL_55_12]OIJ74389.1 MAG: 50S ribosomal protein L9 [Deltaproteobacteria bacterium GWC2_55_46]HBG47038.1 50S ribosomal protein L9 [Deltaproteobacteria bacterium]HCY10902.1 50S ribosomal protein L9 [Deltaproteobacteria bacterium]
MRVILKKEVENLGTYGDVVKVAPGYARNFLIPQGMATAATAGNIRQFEAEKEAYLNKMQVKKDHASTLKARLDAVSLSFSRKTSEEDKMFGSVTAHDIEEGLKAQGFEIERKNIVLDEHIKSLGQFNVAIKLHPGVAANITVNVVKED